MFQKSFWQDRTLEAREFEEATWHHPVPRPDEVEREAVANFRLILREGGLGLPHQPCPHGSQSTSPRHWETARIDTPVRIHLQENPRTLASGTPGTALPSRSVPVESHSKSLMGDVISIVPNCHSFPWSAVTPPLRLLVWYARTLFRHGGCSPPQTRALVDRSGCSTGATRQ